MANAFYNAEYERSVLGIMLVDNELIDVISGRVSEDYFFDQRNKSIYLEIVNTFKQKKCVTILSLCTAFPSIIDYIAALTDDAASTANWTFYVEELKRLFLARKLRTELGEKVSTLTPDSIIDTIHDLDSSLSSYMKFEDDKPKTTSVLMNELIQDISKAFENTNAYLGYDTGWQNLSEILDGLQRGQLYVIAARPSIGKTAFSNQMIFNLAKQGIPCSIISLEMTAKVLMVRGLACESNLSITSITHGLCAKYQEGITKLQIAADKFYKMNLNIYDKTLKNEKELYSKIRVEAKTKGTKVFLIDHIGLVRYSNPNAKRNEALDDITSTLLQLAQELNVAIIILSQLNRDAEGKKPTLAEIRDSGAIEQNADVCMFIHRERASSEQDSQIETEILVTKNRHGSCGSAKMLFFPKSTKFVEFKEEKFR